MWDTKNGWLSARQTDSESGSVAEEDNGGERIAAAHEGKFNHSNKIDQLKSKLS
jgi:hypothetical protein